MLVNVKPMVFSRREAVFIFSYKINRITFKYFKSFKDLGIFFDSKLTFNDHVLNISMQAIKALRFVITNTR